MACSINRNEKGNIVSVTTPEGIPSKLFQEIHSNLFLADAELSLSIFTNAYVENLPETIEKYPETGEPKLFYRTNNNKEFDNLEEAVLNDIPGSLTMGFKDGEKFLPVSRLNTASSEKNIFLVSQVKEGTLSASRELSKDGITRYKGKGEFESTRYATAIMARFNLATELGIGNTVVQKDGTLEIEFPTDAIIAEKDGEITVLKNAEVKEKAKDFDNVSDILVEFHQKNNTVQALDKSLNKDKETPKVDPNSIVQSLYTFLNSLGFSTTTLEEYRKNYNTKYGQDPDIQALADIANKIVAFQEGNISIDQLSEEVAHIAIESYSDQNSIVSALVNVHLSPEYNQYSEYYRQKYSPFYEGLELEEQVRKEVLGKILAKQFVAKFETVTTNEEYGYLLGVLKNIWDSFVNFISGRFKSFHSRNLEALNKKIADSVLRNDMSRFQNDLSLNENFFYDAMDKSSQNIEFTLKAARKTIEDLSRGLDERVPRENELDNIYDGMTEIDTLRSVNTITGIASNLMGRLESDIAEADRKNDTLDQKSENIYNILSQNLLPTLNSLRLSLEDLLKQNEIKGSGNKVFAEKMMASIEELALRRAAVEPKINREKEKTAKRILNEVLKDANLTPDQEKQVRSRFEGNMKDMSFFGKLFGLISHSQNPVLQLISRKVVELQIKVSTRFRDRLNKDVDTIFEKGYQKYQGDIIKKDSKGKRSYYYMSPWNWTAFDNAKEENKLQLLAKYSGKSLEEVTKLSKKQTSKDIIADDIKFKEFRKDLKKWNEENTQKRFKPEYYEDRKAKFEKVGVLDLTQETLSNFNSRSFEILRPYMNQDGTIDKSRLSDADKKALADIRRDKEFTKSAYDAFGQVKEGLRIVKKEELTQEEIDKYFPKDVYPLGLENVKGDIIVPLKGLTKEDLHEDARVTYDMNNLVVYYLQDIATGERSNKPAQAFLDQIRKIEEEGASAYDWVLANATLTLSDEYYDNLGSFVGYADTVEKYINTLPTGTPVDVAYVEDMRSMLEKYKDLNRRRKNLLKQNRKLSNPIETNVNDMDTKLRKAVLELDDEISRTRKEMRIPSEVFEGQEATASKTLNEDYYKMLEESGLSEYDFALKHMARDNRRNVEDFAYEISALINGQRKYVRSQFENFFQEMVDNAVVQVEVSEGKITNKDEVIKTLIGEYAKRNLGSYFQRFAPEGYEGILDRIKSGEIKMSEVIENRDQLIREYPSLKNIVFNPDYAWTEDINNEDYVNPNYKKGGYYVKPDIKYLDKEFFDRYGISQQDFLNLPDENLSNLKPTKNIEEYEFLTMMVKLREDSLALYGDTDKINKYLQVQRSSSAFEKVFTKDGARAKVKDLLDDFTQNRVDEKEYGEQIDGLNLMEKGSEVSVRTIPKYFQNKLESPEMISQNVLENAMQDYHQALQYDERKKIEKDVKALEWKIAQQHFVSNGGSVLKKIITKKGEVSNFHEKAVEYINHHFYGIQQTRSYKTVALGREWDLTRMVNKVQGFARFSNLGFNAFVDLTGATTGILNNAVDKIAGDYYHKSSSNRARGQVAKFLPGYVAEIGKMQKSTKMSSLLEFFDVVEPGYRVKESKFGRTARLAQRSPYLLSKLSNMFVTPQVLFSMLNDFRYVDGKFRTFNEFKSYKQITQEGISVKQIEAQWKALENDSFFDNLDIKDSNIKPTENFYKKFDNRKEADEEFEKVRFKIISKAKQVIQSVDGVISDADRVAAQRDVLTNMFMMHRGWLIINLTKRFKKAGYNMAINQYEEGQYVTVMNAFKELAKSVTGKGAFKEYYQNVSPEQKRNLRRFAVETAGLLAIMALGKLVLEGDDEDDTWIEDLGQLIYIRTASEYASSQILGIPGSLMEAAKSPVTTIQTYEAMNPVMWVTEFDEYDSEGNNKLLKKLGKATVFKRYGQYSDLQKQLDAFRYYNDPTLLWLGSVGEKSDENAAESAKME